MKKIKATVQPSMIEGEIPRRILVLWGCFFILFGMGIGMIIITLPLLIFDILDSFSSNLQHSKILTNQQDIENLMWLFVSIGLAGGLFFHGLPFTSRHESNIIIEDQDTIAKFIKNLEK